MYAWRCFEVFILFIVLVFHIGCRWFVSGDYEAAVPLIEETREIIQSLDDSRRGTVCVRNRASAGFCSKKRKRQNLPEF